MFGEGGIRRSPAWSMVKAPSLPDSEAPKLSRNSRSGFTGGWLFPGHLPGQLITPARLGQRLGRLGIDAQTGRRAAMLQLATTVLAGVLADLLGIQSLLLPTQVSTTMTLPPCSITNDCTTGHLRVDEIPSQPGYLADRARFRARNRRREVGHNLSVCRRP